MAGDMAKAKPAYEDSLTPGNIERGTEKRE